MVVIEYKFVGKLLNQTGELPFELTFILEAWFFD